MNSTKTPSTTEGMNEWQREFIQFAIQQQVLQFGEFTLKSGRNSPYFFNAGHFNDGKSLNCVGEIYAKTLMLANLKVDMLFGPAYKGIPLAAATAFELNKTYNKNVTYAYNRKEIKTHGEGGVLVGAPLEGNVVLVDDVITAGTAIRESIELIKNYPKANLVGAIVLIDRQEKEVNSHLSAIQALEKEQKLSVFPAIKLDQIVSCLRDNKEMQKYCDVMEAYQKKYGIVSF